MSHLLVEIGVEELPTDALDLIYSEMPKRLSAALADNRIGCDPAGIKIEATPRRISLYVSGIALKQKDQTLEFSGPSFEKAYQANEPTQALLGFLKSKNAELKEVQIRDTPKGKFVYLVKEEKGKLVTKVLPLMIQNLLTSLVFPKAMRWDGFEPEIAKQFRFPRPIRWIVALLDKQIVPIQLAGLKAGTASRGHRFLAPKPFKIFSADWMLYQKTLKKNHVILNFEERQRIIREELQSKYHQTKIDEDLLRMVAQLVEEPFLLSGTFDADYLQLPAEVLATVMKKNQKIFACYDAKGEMENRFVAVLNGKRKNLERIRADFENVLESRLKDARYFYREDTKQPLETRVEKLQQIVYLGKLGTMKDKTERLEKLAGIFCKLSGNEASQSALKRAARLCKADLLTHLVYEMPELQGTIGGEYAKQSGEKQEVADAIAVQYLPKNLTEDYQSIKKEIHSLGAMLGLMDRFDLLVGAFGMGLEPTGSQDPFALRRAGGIIVKLVRAYQFHCSFQSLIEENLKLYGSALKLSSADLQKKLSQFFQDRTVFELGLSAGTRSYEIAQAVYKSSGDDLADVFERYEILTSMFEKENQAFVQAAKVIERTANILKGMKTDPGKVNEASLKEEMETRLYQVWKVKSPQVSQFLQQKKYWEATRMFAESFAQPVNDFFSKVLVNVEDAEIRRNRQALLKEIYSLYADRLADLSLLSRLE